MKLKLFLVGWWRSKDKIPDDFNLLPGLYQVFGMNDFITKFQALFYKMAAVVPENCYCVAADKKQTAAYAGQ